MTTKPSLLDWSSVVPALLESLQRSGSPMTAAQLAKSLTAKPKPSAVDVGELMETEVSRGTAYRWEPAKGKTPRYWGRSPDSVVRPALLEALGQAEEPITADDYRKRFKVDAPASLLKTVLQALVEEGKAQRYEPLKGKEGRYWAGDPNKYARRIMLSALAKGKGKAAGPMTWTELAKAVKPPLKQFTEDQLSQVLQDLLDKREAFKGLKFTPSGPDRYSTLAPDLVALVRDEIDVIYKKFAKAGVAREDVAKAAQTAFGAPAKPATGDLAADVLAVFHELRREQYSHTGLVPIPTLRRRIAAEKGAHHARHDVLDDVIKQLVKQERFNILPMEDGTGISVEDRNDAIPGAQELWFYLEARR